MYRQLYILDEGILSYTTDKEIIFLLYILGDVKSEDFKIKTQFVFSLYWRSLYLSYCKVKCTLLQALRLCTGRTVHRGSRGIALLRLCTGHTVHRGSRSIALLRLCTGRTAHRGSRSIALLRLCTGRTANWGSKGTALIFHDQPH